MSPRAPKQKRLSLEEKAKLLKKLDSGVRANRLAIDFGITESAVSQIKKQKAEIFKACANSYQETKKKTLHKAEYEDLESKLYEWFLQQRAKHAPVSGIEMKANALKLFAKIYPDKKDTDFTASDGWFTKFKRRHGIRFKKICGEILSSDTSMITSFVHTLRAKINEMGITNTQLYNADESGLFYRLLPDRTYIAACEKTAPGRKIRKERVSFLLCSNTDGSHKVKPLVIGKAANPRCFKGFQNPLGYDHSKKAWMTSRIFVDWFHNSFVKEVRQFSKEQNLPPKALLLLDNCSAHSPIESLTTEDGKIQAMMLPPNVTAVVQPMDQNPIKIVKLKYRNTLLSNIVAQEEVSVHYALQNHTIKSAILMLKSAWDNLRTSIIEKSWTKLLNWDDNEYDEEDNVPLAELMSSHNIYCDEIEQTQQLLSKLGTDCTISVEDIETWNEDFFDDAEIESEDSEDEEAAPENEHVSYTDAIHAANKLMKWCENNADLTDKHMSNLLQLRSDIVKKQLVKPPKQTKLTSFFSTQNV